MRLRPPLRSLLSATKAGLQTKKKYREKAEVKRQLLNHLSMLNVSSKAKLSHEKIENLIKLL